VQLSTQGIRIQFTTDAHAVYRPTVKLALWKCQGESVINVKTNSLFPNCLDAHLFLRLTPTSEYQRFAAVYTGQL
jgi:hypothetical protein